MEAKVFIVCGKICAGKSTYTKKLIKEKKAVNLSVDEITLALFGSHCGQMHDTYCERTQNYLFNKSLQLVKTGINVILDWGFWQKKERDFAKQFFKNHNIQTELHYIDVSYEKWQQNLEKRNARILQEEAQKNPKEFSVPSDYFIDQNIAAKFHSLFEVPTPDEVDVWVK